MLETKKPSTETFHSLSHQLPLKELKENNSISTQEEEVANERSTQHGRHSSHLIPSPSRSTVLVHDHPPLVILIDWQKSPADSKAHYQQMTRATSPQKLASPGPLEISTLSISQEDREDDKCRLRQLRCRVVLFRGLLDGGEIICLSVN